jgi:MFS family permease
MAPEAIAYIGMSILTALYAVLIHYVEPWYLRRRLTIFSVVGGVMLVGGMSELLFGVLYDLADWPFYRARIIMLFLISGAIMGVQQFIRWYQLHQQEQVLVWEYFRSRKDGEHDEEAA